tara:strand:+ start:462 stop:701 length:240 start_codon:yes stop_codon:yes gene_type:complete
MDVEKWLDGQRETEGELLEKAEAAISEVVSNLLPRARKRAMEENFNTEIVVNVKMDLAKAPKVTVEGFVPPKILKCQKF